MRDDFSAILEVDQNGFFRVNAVKLKLDDFPLRRLGKMFNSIAQVTRRLEAQIKAFDLELIELATGQ